MLQAKIEANEAEKAIKINIIIFSQRANWRIAMRDDQNSTNSKKENDLEEWGKKDKMLQAKIKACETEKVIKNK